jgi:hypothetical protein
MQYSMAMFFGRVSAPPVLEVVSVPLMFAPFDAVAPVAY